MADFFPHIFFALSISATALFAYMSPSSSAWSYRTRKTLKSKKKMEQANAYSSELLLKLTGIVLIVEVACIVLGTAFSLLIPIGVYVIGLIVIVIMTDLKI